ncbi:MAG: hypothetical protein AAFP22_08060 [Planctomycetota bacterium]
MPRPSPQSFEKRQREIRKRLKRAEKLERRLIRNEEKRYAKEFDPDSGAEHSGDANAADASEGAPPADGDGPHD